MIKFLSFLKSPSTPLGLDISDLSLKLIVLDKNLSFNFFPNRQSFRLLAFNQTTVPLGYFEEGKIIAPEKIASLIKKLLKETQSPKKLSPYVVSVLPETKAFIKLIEIPNVPEEKIKEKIAEEIKNHFPFSLNEIYLDWQKLDSIDTAPEKIKILLTVSPKEIVEQYTNLLLAAGLKPYILEIESSAICRALLLEEINPRFSLKSKTSAVAIIDFGATRTSLIFYDQNTIQFTTNVPFSGQRLTEKIQKKLNLTAEEAEKAKIKCGLDEKKCQGALKKILFDDLEEMLVKIKNSFFYYKQNFPQNNPIEKILTCGGGANFLGLDSLLEKNLGIKTELANPLINIKTSKKTLPLSQATSYTTAIGLALRGLLANE